MKKTIHQSTEQLFDNLEKQQKGAIIRKPGSKRLYVLFYYFGKRIEKSTGLKDTPKNRKKVREWLDRQMEKIEAHRFIFSEAFPDSLEKEKADFAKLEGWQYHPEPKDILFGAYVQNTWYPKAWNDLPEGTKKDDYQQIIDYWLLPYFKDKTFFQISGVEVKAFINTLKRKKGPSAGMPLSKARVKNILIPLRCIWSDAVDQFRWNLPSPFVIVRKHLPKSPAKKREGFRFDEWLEFLKHIDPWYQPVVELMIMTGMIHSELAGLRKSDIRADYILVQNTVVRQREKDSPKYDHRIRKVPITQAIKKRLDILLFRSTSDRIVTTPTGMTFNPVEFRKNTWKAAQKASGIDDKVPYCLRHSFAAWALCLRMDPNKLVRLMGHGSKKMVYEVYGDYIDGLEDDFWQILEYFGQDFIQPKMKPQQVVIDLYMQQTMQQQPVMIPEQFLQNGNVPS